MGQKILTLERSLYITSEDNFYSQRSKLQGRESTGSIRNTRDMQSEFGARREYVQKGDQERLERKGHSICGLRDGGDLGIWE